MCTWNLLCIHLHMITKQFKQQKLSSVSAVFVGGRPREQAVVCSHRRWWSRSSEVAKHIAGGGRAHCSNHLEIRSRRRSPPRHRAGDLSKSGKDLPPSRFPHGLCRGSNVTMVSRVPLTTSDTSVGSSPPTSPTLPPLPIARELCREPSSPVPTGGNYNDPTT